MLKELFQELLPPGTPPITRWRLVVAGLLLASFVHVLWACGGFERWGLIGFARADDVDKKLAPVTAEVKHLQGTVKEIQLQQLEQNIFDSKRSECTSTDVDARRFFATRTLTLARTYYELSGTQVTIPPCPDGKQ